MNVANSSNYRDASKRKNLKTAFVSFTFTLNIYAAWSFREGNNISPTRAGARREKHENEYFISNLSKFEINFVVCIFQLFQSFEHMFCSEASTHTSAADQHTKPKEKENYFYF